jgi:hypothetical protein
MGGPSWLIKLNRDIQTFYFGAMQSFLSHLSIALIPELDHACIRTKLCWGNGRC